MKKEKRNPRSHELIREMIELYHPQSIKDIQEMLKDMFADTMEDMLKAELDTELGYSKNSQAAKTTENRQYTFRLPFSNSESPANSEPLSPVMVLNT